VSSGSADPGLDRDCGTFRVKRATLAVSTPPVHRGMVVVLLPAGRVAMVKTLTSECQGP
jgi:hypothetical protein